MKFRRIVGILSVLFLAIAFYEVAKFDSKQGRLDRIERYIQSIDQAELTYLTDLEQNPGHPLEAEFELPNQGRMFFTFLNPSSFDAAPHISLVRIGNRKVMRRALHDNDWGYGIGLNVGADSPVPAIRALSITNVQSALSRYHALMEIVSAWPTITNDWPSAWPVNTTDPSAQSPEEIGFTDNADAPVFYSVRLLEDPEPHSSATTGAPQR